MNFSHHLHKSSINICTLNKAVRFFTTLELLEHNEDTGVLLWLLIMQDDGPHSVGIWERTNDRFPCRSSRCLGCG